MSDPQHEGYLAFDGPDQVDGQELALIAARESMLGDEERWRDAGLPESWALQDVAVAMVQLAAGTLERPKPTVGHRSDGAGLFYRGRLNMLFGKYGSARVGSLKSSQSRRSPRGIGCGGSTGKMTPSGWPHVLSTSAPTRSKWPNSSDI